MMLKKVFFKINTTLKWMTFSFMFFIYATSFGQQTPHYTQYLYNMQIINPGYVGVRSDLSFSVLSRKQWVGVEGAPTTNTFSVNGRTKLGLGLGVTFINDKIGLSEINNVNVDAAYTLVISEYGRLSLGLKLGTTFFSNNFADGITPDNDFYTNNTGNFYNIGFGGFYYTDRFFVGFSVPSILESPQFFIAPNTRGIQVAEHQNYFLSTGVLLELSEDILFKPSTMVRYTTNSPISFDVNASFLYKEIIETGISFRNKSSVSALFAVIVNKNFRIGYAYDYRIEKAVGNLNTHEIVLQLDIDLKRNTRWLRTLKCYF